MFVIAGDEADGRDEGRLAPMLATELPEQPARSVKATSQAPESAAIRTGTSRCYAPIRHPAIADTSAL